MRNGNREFLLNTAGALLYHGLAALLLHLNPVLAYLYFSVLFLIAGLHLMLLFIFALWQIRKFRSVGFTGYSILSVLLIHVIFWLLFINIP